MSSSSHFEIEIKSLLITKENADTLLAHLREYDPELKQVEDSKQLNHYFIGRDVSRLGDKLLQYFPANKKASFAETLRKGKKISVRTRQQNDKVIFVMKASIDDTTSSNGISRMEFEVEIPELNLDQLDKLFLDAGLQYQAKWSRERRAFQLHLLNAPAPITVCIDKNAGYGYLAEFEMVIDDANQAETAMQFLRNLMKELHVTELEQSHLEKMFSHYNAHWSDFYGTDKIFTDTNQSATYVSL